MKLLEQRKYPKYGLRSKLNLRSLLELQRVLRHKFELPQMVDTIFWEIYKKVSFL